MIANERLVKRTVVRKREMREGEERGKRKGYKGKKAKKQAMRDGRKE